MLSNLLRISNIRKQQLLHTNMSCRLGGLFKEEPLTLYLQHVVLLSLSLDPEVALPVAT
jgi:hypothetical protein